MHGGADRADHFARRLLAMHAGDGLEVRLRRFGRSLMVAIDTDPVHLAPALALVGADDRSVVLCLTGDGAGAAADAGIEVDDHAPESGRESCRASVGQDV